MKRLTHSESCREHPATLPYLYLALVRLRLRIGAKQLGLLKEPCDARD